ncbi:tyrosyl-tRNA synthetase [Roseibium sp.]|uniref:tyrosyl-tRNA synthetase n=1 Tax=Roseibium sp. TaxID=1936156 RepID=UPI003BAFDF31
MFRKFAIAVSAVAVLATATVALAPTQAHAKNRAGAVAAGAIIGLAAGAIIANQARPRYHAPVRCTYRPVTRWDPYYGRYVVVAHRRVCY